MCPSKHSCPASLSSLLHSSLQFPVTGDKVLENRIAEGVISIPKELLCCHSQLAAIQLNSYQRFRQNHYHEGPGHPYHVRSLAFSDLFYPMVTILICKMITE